MPPRHRQFPLIQELEPESNGELDPEVVAHSRDGVPPRVELGIGEAVGEVVEEGTVVLIDEPHCEA